MKIHETLLIAVLSISAFGSMTSSAQASCETRHLYQSMADQTDRESEAYLKENDLDMMRISDQSSRHWRDMADGEECEADDLKDAQDAQQALHEEHVAAAYAKAHPSKWSLSHPFKDADGKPLNRDAGVIKNGIIEPEAIAEYKGLRLFRSFDDSIHHADSQRAYRSQDGG